MILMNLFLVWLLIVATAILIGGIPVMIGYSDGELDDKGLVCCVLGTLFWPFIIFGFICYAIFVICRAFRNVIIEYVEKLEGVVDD